MKTLKVYYEDTERINGGFDTEIKKLAEKYGLKMWASGFDYQDKVRDMCFEKPTRKAIRVKQ